MGHNHSHGGGHSHEASYSNHNGKVESVFTNRITRSGSLSTEKQNINVRAAFIHVLGDIVQSVGVLIAAYIIKFKVRTHLSYKLIIFPLLTFMPIRESPRYRPNLPVSRVGHQISYKGKHLK